MRKAPVAPKCKLPELPIRCRRCGRRGLTNDLGGSYWKRVNWEATGRMRGVCGSCAYAGLA